MSRPRSSESRHLFLLSSDHNVTGDNSRACPADLNLQTPVLFPKHNGVKPPALIGVIGTIDPLFPFLGSYFVMASPTARWRVPPARGSQSPG